METEILAKKEIARAMIADVPLVQTSYKNGKPLMDHNTISFSEKLDKAIKKTIKRIEEELAGDLRIDFRPSNIKIKALAKALRVRSHRSGAFDYLGSPLCSARDNYYTNTENMSIHVHDIECGAVKIYWRIVIINGTNKIYLHPDFYRGHNEGLLERLGIVKDIPPLPDLPEKVILGEEIPSLVNKSEYNTLFFVSEIEERFKRIEKYYKEFKERFADVKEATAKLNGKEVKELIK